MDEIFGRLSWREPLASDTRGFTRAALGGSPWVQLGASGRASLYQAGPLVVAFDGSSETTFSAEQVARSYQKDKALFLQTLQGGFSFALWDEEEKTLLLARDRVGRRPLWWSCAEGVVSFSSSLSEITAPVDEDAVRSYLRWGYMTTPFSGKRGWAALPAGSFIIWSADHASEPRPYWDLRVPPRVSRCRDSSSVVAQRARSLLLQSTTTSESAALMIRDGALSGALLSSRPGAFTATYLAVGEHAAQQVSAVKEFAAHYRSPCRAEIYQAPGAGLPSIEQLFHHIYHSLESPCADITLPEKILAIEFASKSAHSIISSLGESFLFGIEEEYQPTAKIEQLPQAARSLFSRAVSLLPKRFFHGEQVTALRQEAAFRRFSLAQKIQARRVLFEIESTADLPLLSSYIQAPRGANVNDRLFYTAFKRELPDECIAPFERLTREKDIALLLPYCSVALAELAATLPKKIEPEAWLKKIFPEAPKPLLQPSQSHVASWLRGPLRSLFFDVLGTPNALFTRFVEPSLVQQLLTKHQSTKQDHSHQLVALFSLEMWMKKQ